MPTNEIGPDAGTSKVPITSPVDSPLVVVPPSEPPIATAAPDLVVTVPQPEHPLDPVPPPPQEPQSELPKAQVGHPGEHSETQVDLSTIRVGDTLDGHVVDFIHGSDTHYIVYESDGRLLYEAHDGIPFKQIATDRSDELMAKSELELRGAYSVTVKKLMAMALVRAFNANSEERAGVAFKAVLAFIDANKPVKQVFARSRDHIVYLDRNGEIVADFIKMEDHFVPIVSEFERLKQSATNNLGAEAASAARNILGYELASALRAGPTPPAPDEAFAASHAFIGERVGADISNRYVFTTLVAAMLFGMPLILSIVFPCRWLVADARTLSLGALAGMIGACISVLQRSGSVASTQFPSLAQIAVQAVVRITLGIVFGLLVVIAAKGNVAFGTFKEARALFMVAVAAGFSERLIPDLLTRLGKTTSDASTAPGATVSGAAADPTKP